MLELINFVVLNDIFMSVELDKFTKDVIFRFVKGDRHYNRIVPIYVYNALELYEDSLANLIIKEISLYLEVADA